MERTEAIEWLKSIKEKYIHGGDDFYDHQRRTAIDYAVMMLEQKQQTNADRIRAMSDEELAEFIRTMVDENYVHDVACYGCINYGTHHSDPANKGTNLYECDGCPSEGIGLDIEKWLKQPAEVK